jgi:hypothetical protein
MLREIRRLHGVDLDGHPYEFSESCAATPAGTTRDPGAMVQGLPLFTLPDGRHLNRLNDTLFLIVPKGVIVRTES